MDDLFLKAEIDSLTTLTVSPIDQQTYREYIDEDTLGGANGYFVVRTSRRTGRAAIEVLAKAPTFEAAATIFDMIVGRKLAPQY